MCAIEDAIEAVLSAVEEHYGKIDLYARIDIERAAVTVAREAWMDGAFGRGWDDDEDDDDGEPEPEPPPDLPDLGVQPPVKEPPGRDLYALFELMVTA